MHKAFGCQVYGFDISERAIKIAEDRVFDKSQQARLWTGDFLRMDLFDPFEDNEFDLVLTVGFLMHIPIGKEKTHQITELMRIGKSFVIFELFDAERTNQTVYEHNGTYWFGI